MIYKNIYENVYVVEQGILLEKSDSEYAHYSQVYDKKNAYYDEFQGYEIGMLKDIKKRLLKEMENAMPNCYAIISYHGIVDNFNLLEEEKEQIEEMTMQELEDYLNELFDVSDLSYSVNDIEFSVYKDENGVIHTDFIKK